MNRNIIHGTQAGYSRKCRCHLCKEAHANYAKSRYIHKEKSPKKVKLKSDRTIYRESLKATADYSFIGKRK